MTLAAMFTTALFLAMPGMREGTADRIANEIAIEVGDDLELGLMLIATARHESSFDPAVENCRKLGDNGFAYGRYQIHSYWFGDLIPEEVCASTKLQTKIAAKIFRHLRRFGKDPHTTLRMYVGNVKPTDPRVTERVKLFDRLTEATKTADAS